MVGKRDILDSLEIFLTAYPDGRERYLEFSEFVEECREGAYCDRKNFCGHLTVSGFIFSREGDRVLMLRHRALGRWLQPGGHLEPSDRSLAEAVLREIREETGFGEADLRALSPLRCAPGGGEPGSGMPVPDFARSGFPWPAAGPVPIGLNSHPIPANPSKREDAHVHYDLRFAFQYAGDPGAVRCHAAESEGFRWVPLEELRGDPDFGEVALRAGELDLVRFPRK